MHGFWIDVCTKIDIGWILVFQTDFKSLFLPCKGFGLTFVPSVAVKGHWIDIHALKALIDVLCPEWAIDGHWYPA